MAFLPGVFGKRGVFGGDGAITRGLSYLDPTAHRQKTVFNDIGNVGRGVKKRIVGVYEDLSGAKDARNATEAQRQGLNQAEGNVNQFYQQAQGYLDPYYQQGTQDYVTLGNMIRNGQFDSPTYQQYQNQEMQPGPYQNQEMQPGNIASQWQNQPRQYQDPGFSYDQNSDPGAQFRMQQGTNAINTNAAMKGSGLSGATLKALAKYGQDLGSQEYGAAFNRHTNQRNYNADQAQNNILNWQNQRNFQYGANQDQLGQYNTNRLFNYGANQDQLAQYNTNRTFGYNAYNTAYDANSQRLADMYSRWSPLANTGTQMAANMGNLATSRGDTLANLAIQRGNTNAAGMVAPGNANRALAGDIFKGAMQTLPYLAGL